MTHEWSFNHVNQLVLCLEEYNNESEFKDAVRDAVMMLIQNDYVCTVKYDEKSMGIVMINYEYKTELGFGNATPYWLTYEQAEFIENRKEELDASATCWQVQQGEL